MDEIISIIRDVLPIIVGALIAIVPTMFEKHYEKKSKKEQKEREEKQKMYTELITLFSKILSEEKNGYTEDSKREVDILRNMINMISITGSINVVKSLNNYIDTWGKSSKEEQNKAYTELLRTIRVDLNIDKDKNVKFPEIGLRDININNAK
ncbi:hypothetical protein [uncultured Clostridium sp.]|uniref:hypothetical protein n=1 Tax=uncultured Clostridium sp. TaxID=59620 RepID=UPI00272A17A9|nr:hypothetical protein [uncultured Clostridium sp.]